MALIAGAGGRRTAANMRLPNATHPLLRRGLSRLRRWNRPWVWTDVILPMAAIRFALLLAGWFSQFILPNPQYGAPDAVERGWHFSQSRLLDMWARWDAGWYFGLIRRGYRVEGEPAVTAANFAFFPLYPYLIKLLALPFPERMHTTERLLIIGLILSNIFLIIALILLHKLVSAMSDRETARRTVLYILLFPTGFILFCFYTESTFLFLSAAAFYAASRKSWWAACVCGGLLALTRPTGILISVPLVWMYLESVGWKPLRMRKNVLWFLLIPSGLVGYFWYAYQQTGDFLAPLNAQKAWKKELTAPWATLIYPYGGNAQVTSVEQVLTVAFLALAVLALYKLPSAAYGIYALLLIIPPLLTGTLISTSRYYVVVFPAFIVLALLGRNAVFDGLVKLVFFSLQIAFVVAWTRFYWVC